MDENGPKCECCAGQDWSSAIRKHKGVISFIIQRDFNKQTRDKNYLRSHGYESLWKALRDYDPDLGYSLSSFLCAKVKFAMVDAIRSRDGRSEATRKAKWPINNTYPLEEAHDESTDFEWDPQDICFMNGEIEAILEMSDGIDERMTNVLLLKMDGYSVAEARDIEGLTQSQWASRLPKLKKKIASSELLVRG